MTEKQHLTDAEFRAKWEKDSEFIDSLPELIILPHSYEVLKAFGPPGKRIKRPVICGSIRQPCIVDCAWFGCKRRGGNGIFVFSCSRSGRYIPIGTSGAEFDQDVLLTFSWI